MNKVLLTTILISLLISGCAMNAEERLDNLEKEVKAIKSDLDFYKMTADSLEAKQNAIEEKVAKLAERKEPSAVAGPLSVQDIQTALKNAGFYSGAIDGKMGPDTATAIKKFQEANGLTADGIVGAKTKGELLRYLTKETD